MSRYTFDLTIEAGTQEEATEKLKAATVLMKKLKSKEITKLAEVVEKDPIKTAFAKKALGL